MDRIDECFFNLSKRLGFSQKLEDRVMASLADAYDPCGITRPALNYARDDNDVPIGLARAVLQLAGISYEHAEHILMSVDGRGSLTSFEMKTLLKDVKDPDVIFPFPEEEEAKRYLPKGRIFRACMEALGRDVYPILVWDAFNALPESGDVRSAIKSVVNEAVGLQKEFMRTAAHIPDEHYRKALGLFVSGIKDYSRLLEDYIIETEDNSDYLIFMDPIIAKDGTRYHRIVDVENAYNETTWKIKEKAPHLDTLKPLPGMTDAELVHQIYIHEKKERRFSEDSAERYMMEQGLSWTMARYRVKRTRLRENIIGSRYYRMHDLLTTR